MSTSYTSAKFWKCALQVNSASYCSSYRGQDHGLSEDEYNSKLLEICQEKDIKVVGLADHGDVSSVDSIRKVLAEQDIIVFPGFEIASSEKAHFVCLFPEDTTTDQLHRYLGSLKLLDPEDGIRPSTLSGEQLLEEVDKMEGLVYAAHCTDDSGVLNKKLNHIWKNPLLKGAQIPGSMDELKNEEGNAYRQILQNKNPDYHREKPVAVMNAKDVEQPETLRDPKASCLIKMTKPCYKSFKQAFLDPESRVRLNFDVPEKYYSKIKKVSFTGGYLDGVKIEFSEHLNAVIGGRGTGKSTLLESIRYGLEIQPLGKKARKQHDEIIKENLGKDRGRIEIKIRSSAMNGKKFIISRKYGESAYVKDEEGNISSFTPSDLLPRVEIYGHNEIYEIAQDQDGQRNLLKRFLEVDDRGFDSKLSEIVDKLQKNRSEIVTAQEKHSVLEDEVSRLPKLKEQVGQFKEFGLEEKLKLVPFLEKEKQLVQRAVSELNQISSVLSAAKDQLPDTLFLSNKVLNGLPHEKILKAIKIKLDELSNQLSPLFTKSEGFIRQAHEAVSLSQSKLSESIKQEEENLLNAFKDIPSCEGRSGKEIGIQFQKILQEIEKIRPKESLLSNRAAVVNELIKKRKGLLFELSEVRSERSAQLKRALKGINKKLQTKLELNIAPEANRKPLLEFLGKCNLEGVGLKRLSWIESAEDFSQVKLAETIRNGTEALKNSRWGITSSVADALVKMKEYELMQIEELEFPDTITIKLNVSHEGAENYRPLDKLSTGQQCTAILHMLLLENRDPLIMDQPEDNLDNAFIADCQRRPENTLNLAV